MEIPDHPHIHVAGFVSEVQKNEAIQKAALLVNPSEYESLSLVILETWQLGIPVVVNGRSDVLAEHCLASNGGLYYTNYDEFVLCLELLLSQQELRHTLGQQGKQYVEARYTWDTVEKTYVDFIMRYA
jgi:glycosyltransferase involved in cell wall biosynthesis